MMRRPLNSIKYYMATFLAVALLLSSFLHFPSLTAFTALDSLGSRPKLPFSDVIDAFSRWDAEIGCGRFRDKYANWTVDPLAVQDVVNDCNQNKNKKEHVSVLVKSWTWIPDSMDGLYSCDCGISCLWTKSVVVADKPDAMLYENSMPPIVREKSDPLRVYMDLEASRKPTGYEDIFIGYHAKDDIQSTYAGSVFHKNRNYHVSPQKRSDILVYWSSSRCLSQRNELAISFLSLVPYHSFGKCLNNVGGDNVGLSLYPECSMNGKSVPQWWDHLHCVMSHYKFVLAIENTKIESYVTEKLYYALDAGAVPIYFGAPNVWDFVPPNSIIDGSKFGSMEELAAYVKALAEDPIAYAEYHAWRRCGVMGNYVKTRAASLDTVPCRLCELISRKGWKSTRTL